MSWRCIEAIVTVSMFHLSRVLPAKERGSRKSKEEVQKDNNRNQDQHNSCNFGERLRQTDRPDCPPQDPQNQAPNHQINQNPDQAVSVYHGLPSVKRLQGGLAWVVFGAE